MSKALTNLKTLDKQVNEEHEAALGCAHAALDHAMEAGRLLAEAKAQVEHGQWLPWLKEHFGGSERTARGYIRLHRNREALEANRQSSADLSIDSALKYLAEPAEDGDSKAETGDSEPEAVDPGSVPLEAPPPAEPADGESVSAPETDAESDEETEADALPVDPYGEVLEPAVAEAFARKGELTGLMHQLSQVKSHVLKACDERDGDPDPLYAPLMPAQFKADLANAYQALKACIPHAACPHCRQIGCDVCQGLGYVNEEAYDRYAASQKHDLSAYGKKPKFLGQTHQGVLGGGDD